MEDTEETNELVSMCREIAKRGERSPRSSAVWIYDSVLDGIQITFAEEDSSHLPEVWVKSRGGWVFVKLLSRDSVMTYEPEPEGWERKIRELHTFLVLREAEVDGYLIGL